MDYAFKIRSDANADALMEENFNIVAYFAYACWAYAELKGWHIKGLYAASVDGSMWETTKSDGTITDCILVTDLEVTPENIEQRRLLMATASLSKKWTLDRMEEWLKRERGLL